MSLAFGFALPHWQAISGGFSPQSLFTGGVQGVLFDISDLSTLFTTSTGTTPVAMPGLGSAVSVGLMLDKSQGLVLGPELVTNGSFSSGTTGWTAQASNNIAVVGGELEITLNSALFSGAAGTSYTLVPGRWYVATATARRGTSAANVTVRFGSGVGEGDLTFTTTSNVTQTRYFVATTTTTTPTVTTSSSSGSGTIYADNISIRELPGNHAIAFNDTTARPELRARVNLLTYSEDFSNAAWTKSGLNAFGSGSVANTNATLDPLGGNTADFIQENTANSTHEVSQIFSVGSSVRYSYAVYVKAAGRNWCQFVLGPSTHFGTGGISAYFDLANGAVGTVTSNPTALPVATIQSVGNGWYLCALSATSNAAVGTADCYVRIAQNGSTVSYTGDGTSGIYIWGADLRPANIGANVPAYQRIADANTYDTSGFPLYLRFDGIDDSMYTPANLNLSGTDKVSVFAGVRKNNNTTQQFIVETSTNGFSNNGALSLLTNTNSGGGTVAGAYGGTFRGTSGAGYGATGTTAPISNVVTALGNIAAATDASILRVNGTQVATSGATSAGTGNFGTYPMYIASRQGIAPNLLEGHLYSLLVVGSAVSGGNISATEQWVAGKTGITL